MIHASVLLRRAFQLDAVVSGAMGISLTVGAAYLATLLNLPEAFLRSTALVIFVWTAIVGFLATRDTLSRTSVWAIIAGNAVWTINSLALLATSWVTPNLLGTAFIVMQAVAVGVFAELQFMGLRRSDVVATVRKGVDS